MNKTELIESMAEKANIMKKDADAVVEALIECIITEVKAGNKVQILGFGTFESRQRAERTGINPRTKEEIKIPATTAPGFKVGKAFKDAVK